MAPSKEKDDLVTLQNTIASTKSLVESFQIALRSTTPPHEDIKNPPQPLALLSDSCRILHAQTTKLSLLILNKPFTPSAITYILTSWSNSCLPAMMSALQICRPEKYTSLLQNYIKSTLSRIMMELLNLLASIPQNERGIEPQNRDTLASTGVLWAECNNLVNLASEGVVSLAVQKAAEYHGLLKDAIAELDEWDPEEDSDSDTDTNSLPSSEQKAATKQSSDASTLASSLDDLSLSPMTELRKRSLAKLRTVRVLYPAIQKRRISIFPNITSSTVLDKLPASANIDCMDSTLASLSYFTEAADEIAGSLYDGDEEQVCAKLSSLEARALECAKLVSINWKADDDEFTEWVQKWSERLQEVGKE